MMNSTHIVLAWILLGGIQAESLAQGTATLINQTQLSADGRGDHWPVISFSDSSDAGIIVWGKGVRGTSHQDMYSASRLGGSWSSSGYVSGQAGTARHHSFSLDFRPGTDEALISFSSSSFAVTVDEMRARTWSPGSGWNPGPIIIGDGVDDNDSNGTVRYSADGSFALAAWRDAPHWTSEPPSGRKSVSVNIFDPLTSSFGGKIVAVPAQGALQNNFQMHDRSLAEDPVTGLWIVLFNDVSSSPFGQLAYAIGTASGGSVSYSNPVLINDPSTPAGRGVISFGSGGQGAMFWSQEVVGEGNLELMASLWNGTGFGSPVTLTSTGVDSLMQAAVPVAGGWQVIFTRKVGCEEDSEIFVGFFDGTTFKHDTRLTSNAEAESDVSAAVDNAGAIHLAWVAEQVGNSLSAEVLVAELSFSGSGLAFSTYGCGCPGAGGLVPELDASGNRVAGGQVVLSAGRILGGTTAFVALGTGPANLPMGSGCSLLVQPPVTFVGPIPVPGTGPGAGEFTLTGTIPSTAVPGLTLATQVFAVDAASSTGFANSNGVLIRIM